MCTRIHQKVSTRIHPLKMSKKICPFWKKLSTRSQCPQMSPSHFWYLPNHIFSSFFLGMILNWCMHPNRKLLASWNSVYSCELEPSQKMLNMTWFFSRHSWHLSEHNPPNHSRLYRVGDESRNKCLEEIRLKSPSVSRTLKLLRIRFIIWNSKNHSEWDWTNWSMK